MPLTPPQAYRKTAFTHRRGLAAARPAAADVLPGTLYFSTDTLVLERSTGAAWESYGSGIPTFTAGSVIFAGAAGELAQDNTNLFFDDSNNFLRVPKIVGGPGTTDDLILQATSGVGTTGSWIFFNVGNNGAVTAMEINHLGDVGIGTTGTVALGRPLTIRGVGSDVGYLVDARASSGSGFIQIRSAGGNANAAAGFSFFQTQNVEEWFMSVVGNDGNAMRWTNVSGGITTTNIAYITTTANIILDTARNDHNGSKSLIFGDGTAPTSLASNTAALFANDVGGTVEMFAINEANEVNQLSGDIILASGKFFISDVAAFMIKTITSWTDGAGASLGTLTNAPTAGDPTKWIPVDDNGTTRFIPAW